MAAASLALRGEEVEQVETEDEEIVEQAHHLVFAGCDEMDFALAAHALGVAG